MKNFKWYLALIALATFGFQVYWNLKVGHAPLNGTADQEIFFHLGHKLEDPLFLRHYHYFYATPMYPFFLGRVLQVQHALGIHCPLRLTAGLAQAVMASAALALWSNVVRRLKSPRAGLVAAVLMALYIGANTDTAILMAEELTTPLMAVVFSLMYWNEGRPSNKRLLAIGSVLGIAVFAKPILLLMPFAIGFILASRCKGRRQAASCLVIIMASSLMLSAGWSLFIQRVTGHVALVSTAGGFNYCLGNNDAATGNWSDEAANNQCKSTDVNNPAEDHRLSSKGLHWTTQHPSKEKQLIFTRWHIMFDNDNRSIAPYYNDDGSVSLYFYPGIAESWNMPGTPQQWGHFNELWWKLIKWSALIGLVNLLIRKDRRLGIETLVLAAAILFIPLTSVADVRYREALTPLLVLWGASLVDEFPKLIDRIRSE